MDKLEKKLIKQIKELLDHGDYIGAKNQIDKLIGITGVNNGR